MTDSAVLTPELIVPRIVATAVDLNSCITLESYISRDEVLNLYNPLAELVYEQKIRIRELENTINELRSAK